jgi:biopolymer transport protein ExbD
VTRGRRAVLRKPRRRADEDERILPLINVVFLLLVFFMVAGRLMASDPFPLDPVESASEGAPADGRLISFGPDGELALDGRLVEEAELLSALREDLAVAPRTEIRLKADGGAAATGLVALLARLRDIGADSVTLMTVPEEM